MRNGEAGLWTIRTRLGTFRAAWEPGGKGGRLQAFHWVAKAPGNGGRDLPAPLRALARAIDRYAARGTPVRWGGRLDPAGTAFEHRVWTALRKIPFGEVRTYGQIARAAGRPGAARAVGGACGANPIPVLIPCHRVVAAGGRLGGFSGGLSRKRRLLAIEGRERGLPA